MLRLSECDKVLILSKLEEGCSIRNVARIFNINKSRVLNVKKKWEEDGSVKRKEGSGRPRISNHQQDEFLTQDMMKDMWLRQIDLEDFLLTSGHGCVHRVRELHGKLKAV
ncbi:hypothetical protein QE152_g4464 [Popillia japonica]|uniref:Transposase n=1 Tax=Popillia japonica TaxID=7064 RepID=A0AAW1MV98_POPJA